MIVPFIVEFIYYEENSTFLASSALTTFIGVLLVLTNIEENKRLGLQQTFLLTALSWLSIAIFGCLPFVFSNLNLSFVDAFFESMSGITTTGSTVIINLDIAPKSILFWRAILQWLGGIGIIVMAITLMPIMNVGGMQLFKISSNDTAEKILPKSKEISIRLIFIYSILTFSCALFYKIFGMNIFDSLTHSMTTIATGGFSNYNESIGHFDSVLIETTSMIFILLGSIPFIAYIKFLNGDRKILLSDTQIKTFFKVIIISIIILFIYLVFLNQSFLEISIRSVSFNVISILTGTGYTSSNFNMWGGFGLIIMFIIMFIGGCAGSTTGGVKIFRLQLLFRGAQTQIKKLIQPHGVFVATFNQKSVSEDTFNSIMGFFFMYILIFFLGSIVLSFFGLDFLTAISASASAISNVGPGLGNLIGPNGNYNSLPLESKWVLSLLMLIGRLELLTFLVLLSIPFWKK